VIQKQRSAVINRDAGRNDEKSGSHVDDIILVTSTDFVERILLS
jgi:hypothetical protein